MRRLIFHTIRLMLWACQIPIALLTDLKTSVAYLVFLSIAALVESAGTDVDKALQDWKKSRRSP
jgi:hypothetical protein